MYIYFKNFDSNSFTTRHLEYEPHATVGILRQQEYIDWTTICKKTTRHHAHLSLCAKSRKTNNAKSRKWPKTSIWAIFGQIFKEFDQIKQIDEPDELNKLFIKKVIWFNSNN